MRARILLLLLCCAGLARPGLVHALPAPPGAAASPATDTNSSSAPAIPSTPTPEPQAPVVGTQRSAAPRSATTPTRSESRPSQDAERPPLTEAGQGGQGPWLVRLSLGIQAGLLRQVGQTELRRPTFANLDLGYAPTRRLTLLLRVSSWLDYEPFALQFVGAGASYFFAPDGMFVTGVVGMSVLDDRAGLPGDSGEAVQGLAFQLDVGQQWALTPRFGFCVGAHAEVGTPWLRGVFEATELGIGVFVSISYR